MKINNNFYLSLIGLFFLLGACNSYKSVSWTNDTFMAQEKWIENSEKYVYLVHTKDTVLELDSVTLVRDSLDENVTQIDGKLKLFKDSTDNLSDNDYKKEIRKRVHIYLSREAQDNIAPGNSISIEKSDIQKVEMMSKKRQGALGVLLTILLGLLGLFILLIVVALVALVTSDGGGGGGSSSGGGGGGNTNGGGSSCYIATMVYGDCDAEEVMVLRRFRDKVLLKSEMGRTFVNWYYLHSPSFVEKHKDKQRSNSIIKAILNMVVRILGKRY